MLFRSLRALRGISTDTGPFQQISVRRIVDYAKAGVRKGANPYIGRLNNVRVRAALRATLDGFLAQMVQDEMLTDYTLDVSATRQQEINGICAVTMTLQPTFSIDFIRVTMNDKTFVDYLQYVVQIAGNEQRPAKEIRALILVKAEELSLPVRGDEITVLGGGDSLNITVHYDVDIEIPLVQREIYTKTFEHKITYQHK